MRRSFEYVAIYTFLSIFSLSACATAPPAQTENEAIELEPAGPDCKHVPVTPVVGKYPIYTDLFEVVLQLACHYGVTVATQISSCATNRFPADYLEGESPDFGLRRVSRAKLHDAYAYGIKKQGEVDDWRAKKIDIKNADICINSIHESSKRYEYLERATLGLLKYGF